MKALTTTVARILFALPLVMFGMFHFMGAQDMSAMVPDFFPGGVFWVYLTGAAHILAAVAILINKMGKMASLLLALMLLIFILSIHVPGIVSAEGMQEMMKPMQNMLKDTMIMAGALTWAGVFSRGHA